MGQLFVSKEVFRTRNVLPFSCTHLAGKRPKVHAKQKGFKNFFIREYVDVPLFDNKSSPGHVIPSCFVLLIVPFDFLKKISSSIKLLILLVALENIFSHFYGQYPSMIYPEILLTSLKLILLLYCCSLKKVHTYLKGFSWSLFSV